MNASAAMTALLILLMSTSATAKKCPLDGSLTLLSINQTASRVEEAVWPRAPKGAKVEGTVVLLIEVGTNGKLSCKRLLRGLPILVHDLLPTLRKWKFRQGEAFAGTLTVRYANGWHLQD
jgi:hypothetical protein